MHADWVISNVSLQAFRLKNVVKVDILITGKCKTKLSMYYSLQTSADCLGSELADSRGRDMRVRI